MFIVQNRTSIWLSLWPGLLFTVTKTISYLFLLPVLHELGWLLVLRLLCKTMMRLCLLEEVKIWSCVVGYWWLLVQGVETAQ